MIFNEVLNYFDGVQPYLFDDTRHDYLPPRHQSKINVANVDYNENGVPVLTRGSLIKLKPKYSLSSNVSSVNNLNYFSIL